MKLIQFRVTDFRSVKDSGWIDVGAVTSLIGTNESGKTNLLLPLWKLNPAQDGEIDPIADYPRSRYAEIKDADEKPVFIRARFQVPEDLANQIARDVGAKTGELNIVEVSRDFEGEYWVEFPNLTSARCQTPAWTSGTLSWARQELGKLVAADEDQRMLKTRVDGAIAEALSKVPKGDHGADELLEICSAITSAITTEELATAIGKPASNAVTRLKARAANLSREPGEVNGVVETIRKGMPRFTYYSNYGNLDSEILLPRVIEDMKRTNLGPKEQARTRTLKVLFDFVQLSPEEIMELGVDPGANYSQYTSEQLEEIAANKTEREILLKSASSRLTREFRDWWKQGEYVFDLQADGSFFKVWVSDSKRPEPVELEGRSTGLQWFLSFFLIFLVERKESHSNAVILLDEPGHSLHPLGQRDLFRFFGNLAETNQIVYTTHSPFLVNPDHLDFVRAVFVGDDGATCVSADLRAGTNPKQTTNSIYPVHAALGLSVSETLLEGCQPILVEGVSDQVYLSALKTLLIRKKKLAPKRELVFIPCGGAKGASTVAAIVMGKEQELPFVLLDSDTIGVSTAKALKSGLYASNPERVLLIGDIIDMARAEIEDVLPQEMVANVVTRLLPRTDSEDFDQIVEAGAPILPQVEAYAEENEIKLPLSWKVQVATLVKQRLFLKADEFLKNDDLVERWSLIFKALKV